MNVSALVVSCLALVAGLRFVVTFRHNNDLYFIRNRNSTPEPGSEVTKAYQESQELDDEPKYSSPTLLVISGSRRAVFGLVTLMIPNGVGLWPLLHL